MAKTNKTNVELFDTFVGNLAGHAASLMTDKRRARMSAVWGLDLVEFRIEMKGETPDVWDQCYQVFPDGTEDWVGNRCGMISRYAKLCAKALREFGGVTEESCDRTKGNV